jgi:hypothetical protein
MEFVNFIKSVDHFDEIERDAETHLSLICHTFVII